MTGEAMHSKGVDPRLLEDTEPYGMNVPPELREPIADVIKGIPSTNIEGVIDACASDNCNVVEEAIDDRWGGRTALYTVHTIKPKPSDDRPETAFWGSTYYGYEEAIDEPNRSMMQKVAESLGIDEDKCVRLQPIRYTTEAGTEATMKIDRLWLATDVDPLKWWSIDVANASFIPRPPSAERLAQFKKDHDPTTWPPIEMPSASCEIWLCPPGEGLDQIWRPSDKPNAAGAAEQLQAQHRPL